MKILLAPDKFKGSLTASEVCEALKEGIISIRPDIEIVACPLADGGEGTYELLTACSHGQIIKTVVSDPLLRDIEAEYGISGDHTTAFIEMAKASGLGLLQASERNPLFTSSFGTGQLIHHALKEGCRRIILGIGGSATNDAGIGMAQALGYKFLSATGEALKPVGGSLSKISSIQTQAANAKIAETEFIVLCDVENPLVGKLGAAYVYGPQKGANPDEVEHLDQGLRNFLTVAEHTFDMTLNFPGAGAAGGMGAGTKAFLNAQIKRGFQFVSEFTHLEDAIRTADLIITGEGKIDHQSLSGKVVKGVADLATRHRKKCIAVTGKIDLSTSELKDLGIEKIIPLSGRNISEAESMNNAYSLLKQAAYSQLKPDLQP